MSIDLVESIVDLYQSFIDMFRNFSRHPVITSIDDNKSEPESEYDAES